MGLTGNTTNALLALNGLDSSPNSAVSVEGTEAGPAESGQKVAVLTRSELRSSPASKGRAAPPVAVRSCLARLAQPTWTPCATSRPG